MIKRIAILILTILLVLSAVSCSMLGNVTEKYLLSMQNMLNADSKESKSKFEVHLDLSKAKDSVKKELEKFKDITLNIDNATDKKSKKHATKLFANVGGMPIEFKIYADGDNAYIKSMLLGEKYYKLEQSDGMKDKGKIPDDNGINMEDYKKFIDEAKQIWVDAVKNEIISSEGTSVENTPDGDIKVSNLSLELTDEKEKSILFKLAEAVSKSKFALEEAKKGNEQYGPKDSNREEVNKEIEKWVKDLPDNMRKYKEQYTLDKMKLTAKVDKDSYLINQTLTGGVTIKDEDIGELKISFSFEETYWNINSKVNVEIPQIKEEDIGDLKDINFENEDFINKFKEGINSK